MVKKAFNGATTNWVQRHYVAPMSRPKVKATGFCQQITMASELA